MPTIAAKARRFWHRHRTLFWILHSIWALATGVVVVVLANERYGFVPWVVVFLVLTWASTMYFGRRTAEDDPEEGEEDGARSGAPRQRRSGEAMLLGDEGGGAPTPPPTGAPPLKEEVSSYLMRIMYQETLFFLLPFYAYSTVFGSINVLFLALLGVLAVVSCLDMVFDKWLRASPVFGLVFFASVAFAGLNLVFPLLLGLSPRWSTRLAGVLAVAAAVPLAVRAAPARLGARLRLAATAVVILALAIGVPRLVPPVPLRLQEAVFAPSIDRATLAVTDSLGREVAAGTLPDGLVVRARVFAPSRLPAVVFVEWRRDGTVVRLSRPIEVTAHDVGFRVWDALRPGVGSLPTGPGLPPGTYRAVLRTRGHRVFGVKEIVVVP